jgi:hypothetical protein
VLFSWHLFGPRFTTGENWDSVMQDAMVEDYCIYVPGDVSVTLPAYPDIPIDYGDNSTYISTLIPGGTYLDKQDNSTLLSALPVSAIVSGCMVTVGLTCGLLACPPQVAGAYINWRLPADCACLLGCYSFVFHQYLHPYLGAWGWSTLQPALGC